MKWIFITGFLIQEMFTIWPALRAYPTVQDISCLVCSDTDCGLAEHLGFGKYSLTLSRFISINSLLSFFLLLRLPPQANINMRNVTKKKKKKSWGVLDVLDFQNE